MPNAIPSSTIINHGSNSNTNNNGNGNNSNNNANNRNANTPLFPQQTPLPSREEAVEQLVLPRPSPDPARNPKLRLLIPDLSQPLIHTLLCYDLPTLLSECVDGVLSTLYKDGDPVREVRSVTLILKSMGGVAFTRGSELDDAHKEIHVSLEYLKGVADKAAAQSKTQTSESNRFDALRYEVEGVLRHEMVHCWQFNAKGSMNGGLVEGIADYVRLVNGLGAKHWVKRWKEKDGAKWDGGYSCTAFFLEWLERDKFKGGAGYQGCVRHINLWGKDNIWDEEKCFIKCFGVKREQLWSQYVKACEKESS